MYYIQNRGPVGNCVMWWAEGGHGYTCNLDRAGKFNRDEAIRIVKNRPDIDKAWPVEEIDNLAIRHFDSQRLRSITPLSGMESA
jgi:hypothetical protein